MDDNPRSILIRLCIPGKAVRNVIVNLETLIKEVQKLTPNGNGLLIHSGVVLSESRNIGFYGIEDRDCVIVLTSRPGEGISHNEKIKWKRLTNDYDEFQSKFNKVYNSRTREECLRLNDLYSSKLLLHSFSKIHIQQKQKAQSSYIVQAGDGCFSYRKPQNIITKALPVFWDS